MNNQMYAPR